MRQTWSLQGMSAPFVWTMPCGLPQPWAPHPTWQPVRSLWCPCRDQHSAPPTLEMSHWKESVMLSMDIWLLRMAGIVCRVIKRYQQHQIILYKQESLTRSTPMPLWLQQASYRRGKCGSYKYHTWRKVMQACASKGPCFESPTLQNQGCLSK